VLECVQPRVDWEVSAILIWLLLHRSVARLDSLARTPAYSTHTRALSYVAAYGKGCARHTDDGDVTVNVCLYTSDDLQGSELLFDGTYHR